MVIPNVPVVAGTQGIRFVFDTNASNGYTGNLNYFTITPVANPAATLNAMGATATGATSTTLSVTYTDNAAIKLASIDGGDLIINGPNSFSAPVPA